MTQADFVRAICDEPDDDALRLVYADWLEDHGQAERAELIRVQCALAADDPPPDRAGLERRERELLRDFGAEWAAPIRHLVSSYEYRRGFIDEAHVEARTFAESHEELLTRAPLRRLHLTWGEEPPHERARLVPRLLASPRLRHLRALDLAHNNLGSAGACALAVCDSLSGLTDLGLSHNHIGAAGARALAASPLLGRLTRLDLSVNDLGAATVRDLSVALRRLEAPPLRLLDLRGNRLGAAGVRELLACPVLRRVAVDAVGDAGRP
jgi:uncharacterized protein (TIGR02996 family)